MSEPLIGEKSCLLKCQDCGEWFHFLEGDKWCEDCFEEGLHKDMNDHFKHTIETEMKETATTACPEYDK